MRLWIIFERHQFKVLEKKKSLAWDFYEPYENDGKDADLK